MRGRLRLLLACVSGLALTLFAAGEETAEAEVARLRAEIAELETRLADPAATSPQTMLRQTHREKLLRLREAQQALRAGGKPDASKAEAPAPSGAAADAPVPMPRATLPPPGTSVPTATRVAAEKRESPGVSSASVKDPLIIYSARELALGAGTLAHLDEVARRLRLNEDAEARDDWMNYLAGERDTLEAQPDRIKALIHFVVRRAHVEGDTDLSLMAARVDAVRERDDPAAIAAAQNDFDARLRAKPALMEQTRRALDLLEDAVRRAFRPAR